MIRRTVLLDTCVLINLLASGECEDILRALNHHWMVCSAVEKESIYLRTDNPPNSLELIDFAPLISASLISVCSVESEVEANLYVNYASLLDDGEAMSLVLALARGHGLATDERKARRLFLEATNEPGRLVGTSEIIRGWVESNSITDDKAKGVLLEITRRARFFPSLNDPYYKWWSDICS